MKYTKRRKKIRIKRKTSYENKNCRFMYISRFIEF